MMSLQWIFKSVLKGISMETEDDIHHQNRQTDIKIKKHFLVLTTGSSRTAIPFSFLGHLMPTRAENIEQRH